MKTACLSPRHPDRNRGGAGLEKLFTSRFGGLTIYRFVMGRVIRQPAWRVARAEATLLFMKHGFIVHVLLAGLLSAPALNAWISASSRPGITCRPPRRLSGPTNARSLDSKIPLRKPCGNHPKASAPRVVATDTATTAEARREGLTLSSHLTGGQSRLTFHRFRTRKEEHHHSSARPAAV